MMIKRSVKHHDENKKEERADTSRENERKKEQERGEGGKIIQRMIRFYK
jgi:hypothetical protein